MRNIRANDLGDRVTTMAKADTDRSGAVAFFLHAEHLDRSGLYDGPGATRRTTVECVSLDAFSGDGPGVDVCLAPVDPDFEPPRRVNLYCHRHPRPIPAGARATRPSGRDTPDRAA